MSTEKPGEDGSLEPTIISSSDLGADNTNSDLKIRPDFEPAQEMPIGFDNLETVGISWAFDAVDRISDEHVPSWQTEADYDTKEEKDRRAKLKQFLGGLEAAGVHGVIVDQTGHVHTGTSKWARRIEASSTVRLYCPACRRMLAFPASPACCACRKSEPRLKKKEEGE